MGKLKINVMLEPGAFMPEKAHKTDAGFDLRVPEGKRFRFQKSCQIFTGVHVEIPEGYYMSVENRSGLNFKHGITLHGTGTIDSGYTGQIGVKLYNDGVDPEYTFEPGDKIAQLIIHPFTDVEFIQVDELEETQRGADGFGSTGK